MQNATFSHEEYMLSLREVLAQLDEPDCNIERISNKAKVLDNIRKHAADTVKADAIAGRVPNNPLHKYSDD